MCGSRAAQRESSAAATEKQKAATAHHTAVGRGALTSPLGTLEQFQQPLSANPSGLLLFPDAPSAGGDGTVVWNVICTNVFICV